VLYAQGRLDEAQQMTEEAQAAAGPADIDAQARWRAARAKVLARGGQFPAARTLLDEAEALASPTVLGRGPRWPDPGSSGAGAKIRTTISRRLQ
jgi:hypothetical protein